jgi:glutamate-1-semialdehyde 2,1-aminomutase
MKFRDRSNSLYDRLCQIIPGGVNSPARSWRPVGGKPMVINKGQGSKIWDIDKNEYIDYTCAWGPLILGHSNPDVLSSIKLAVDKGTGFGTPTELEHTLAKIIVTTFPSVDMVRFVNSGTEAVMSALRLSRAFTGRQKVIKFEGGYHGHVDSMLVASGSGAISHGIPNSKGVDVNHSKNTLIASYNDISSVEAIFNTFPEDIASVIVEPVAGNMGVIPPQKKFLDELRKITHKFGTLLIFDEVITGYRVQYQGAQGLYNVNPDITCLGKIIGGGLPVGAYGAKREIMEMVSPLGEMYQAGTLSGNSIVMAAGSRTLELLDNSNIYQELERKSHLLATGLEQAFRKANEPVQINRVGSMMTVFFTSKKAVTDYHSACQSNTERFAKFFHKMLNSGVYLPPSQYEAMFVSAAHSDSDIQTTIEAAKGSL